MMIVGTGNVGASIAYALINQRTAVNEIVLTDIIAKDAEGEAMDLRDALAVAPSYVKISNGTYKDAKDCDVVVITAGAAQKPGETRMQLLKKNVNILKGMIDSNPYMKQHKLTDYLSPMFLHTGVIEMIEGKANNSTNKTTDDIAKVFCQQCEQPLCRLGLHDVPLPCSGGPLGRHLCGKSRFEVCLDSAVLSVFQGA